MSSLVAPTQALSAFGFELRVEELDYPGYGIGSVGVFVAPDALTCATPFGVVTAASDAAWFDDGFSTPYRRERAEDFIVDWLESCPGAREFWDSPLYGRFPFEFEPVGTDAPIEGFPTTRVQIRSTDPAVEVSTGSLWVTGDGWPIRLHVEGSITGGIFSVLGDPFTLGDDPELDALWLACDDGDLAACDVLYERSPHQSAYQLFAQFCGLRYEPAPDTACTDNRPEPEDEPFTLGDDPVLDDMWLRCADGEPEACDDLYDNSPVDSAYELYGEFCGLRVYTDLEPCAEVLALAKASIGFAIELILTDIEDPTLAVHGPDGSLLAGAEGA
jgi:hypothetical protein